MEQIRGKTAAGEPKDVLTDSDGRVQVGGTFTIDATSLAQETTLGAVRDRLPAALTGAGSLKVAVAEALPAGTNVLGSTVPTNSAGAALLPTATALSNSSATNPTTTKIGAVALWREENSDTLRRVRCTAQNDLYVQPLGLSFQVSSRTSGTAYEFQRGINFGCAPAFVRVFVSPAAVNATTVGTTFYALLVSKNSAAVNGDAPFGADVQACAAGQGVLFTLSGAAEPFSVGCQMVLSETPDRVTLPATAWGRFTFLGN